MLAHSWGDSLTCPPGDVYTNQMEADGETERRKGEEKGLREEEREGAKEKQGEEEEEAA